MRHQPITTSSLLALLFTAATRAIYTPTTISTCDSLDATLPGRVIFPEEDTYNNTITAYPFLQLRLHPACIVRPTSANEVSTTLQVIRDTNCTSFAVKGGGHNANAGFNNIEDGVTIDMHNMSDVSMNGDIVQVGAGSIWQGVYDEVEKTGRSVLGGRIGVVGVAGFSTGGGISFNSPARGWSCDSVQNFELVLASGEIVNANATSRHDLFTALKGGQSNFGIVTRFDFSTFEQGTIWGGRTVYAPTADTALLSAFADFKDGEYDTHAAGWVTIRYNHTAASFTPISILWYTDPATKPGALKGMLDVQPKAMSMLVEANSSEHTRNASKQVTAEPKRTIWGTVSFHNSPVLVQDIYKTWKALVPVIGAKFAYAGLSAELTFQSIPPTPKDENEDGKNANSLGFDPNSKPEKDVVFLQAVLTSEDARADEGLQDALKELIGALQERIEKAGAEHDFVYLNFAASWQDPFKGYGKERVKKLKEVARKYDPEGLFQRQLSGGFKISDV